MLCHHERVLLGKEGLLLVGEAVHLNASTSKLLVGAGQLHRKALLLQHLLVTLEGKAMDLALKGLASGLPLLKNTLGGLEFSLEHHLVLEVTLQTRGLRLADGELLASLAQRASELLLR